MDTATFNQFRDIVYERSGITLKEGKEALVQARVGKRLRALGLSDYGAYLRRLKEDVSGGELVLLLDAISTNVTSFFREPAHFDFLAERVNEWRAEGQTKFRFWSAASSTGEEPYSIAMTLLETLGPANASNVKILATDLNTQVVERAMRGVYSAEKSGSLPPLLRSRYFKEIQGEKEACIAIADEVKRLVSYGRLNLSKPPFPMQGPFDMVFCRNVMIYFDDPVRKRLLEAIYDLLRPGGFLLVGHSESLTGMIGRFKSVQPSVYRKP